MNRPTRTRGADLSRRRALIAPLAVLIASLAFIPAGCNDEDDGGGGGGSLDSRLFAEWFTLAGNGDVDRDSLIRITDNLNGTFAFESVVSQGPLTVQADTTSTRDAITYNGTTYRSTQDPGSGGEDRLASVGESFFDGDDTTLVFTGTMTAELRTLIDGETTVAPLLAAGVGTGAVTLRVRQTATGTGGPRRLSLTPSGTDPATQTASFRIESGQLFALGATLDPAAGTNGTSLTEGSPWRVSVAGVTVELDFVSDTEVAVGLAIVQTIPFGPTLAAGSRIRFLYTATGTPIMGELALTPKVKNWRYAITGQGTVATPFELAFTPVMADAHQFTAIGSFFGVSFLLLDGTIYTSTSGSLDPIAGSPWRDPTDATVQLTFSSDGRRYVVSQSGDQIGLGVWETVGSELRYIPLVRYSRP